MMRNALTTKETQTAWLLFARMNSHSLRSYALVIQKTGRQETGKGFLRKHLGISKNRIDVTEKKNLYHLSAPH